MLKNYSIEIYNKASGTKVNGIFIPGALNYIKTVDVDIQPYSTALLLKEYGYDIEVNKRIFMDADADVKIGTIFYYTNPQGVVEKYQVKKIIDWDYVEVMCLGI